MISNQRLLNDGLRRLREGKAPTKAQLPFVQQWLLEHDEKIRALHRKAEDARIGRDVLEEQWQRLSSTWNATIDVIRDFGIEIYIKANENHGWQGQVGDAKAGQEGYASLDEVLRAALAWRLEQVHHGKA